MLGHSRWSVATSRSLQIGACQHDEQRRRVDAAVIPAKRHFPQFRHLAVADLMEDLAWFGVARRIEGRSPVGCEMEKHAARNCGIEPEGLEGGDQRVAAKHGAEPGDSSVRERPLRRIRDQGVEVRDRTAKRFVEDVIGGDHRSGPGGRCPQRPPRLTKRAEGGAVQRFAGARAIAADSTRESFGAWGRDRTQRSPNSSSTGRAPVRSEASWRGADHQAHNKRA